MYNPLGNDLFLLCEDTQGHLPYLFIKLNKWSPLKCFPYSTITVHVDGDM